MTERPHEQMLRDIVEEARLTGHLTGIAAFDPRIMAAIKRLPREEFVPAETRFLAFRDGPIPIGHGQTISQPFIVALMTQLLDPTADSVILEVGTGSGYQAAVLAILARQVYSIEIIPALSASATERLARLGFANVTSRQGDGYEGWPEHAPYDGIIVTAAAPHVPPPLLQQLKAGGRLVIPIGESGWTQTLKLLAKGQDGAISEREVLDVAFVPLTGDHVTLP